MAGRLEPHVKVACVAVTVGGVVGVIKGDEAGVLASLGNLVSPWLFVPIVLCPTAGSRLRAAFLCAFATPLTLVTFYLAQALLWGIFSRYSIPYAAFWITAGTAMCCLHAAAVGPARPRLTRVSAWLLASAVWAVAYGVYLLHAGFDPLEDYARTVWLAASAFVAAAALTARLARSGVERHPFDGERTFES